MVNVELMIENKGFVYTPIVLEGITWESVTKGAPSVLKFSIIKDSVIDVVEGNCVQLRVDGVDVFIGFIFYKDRGKDNVISITAYDQLRYLKNKDTYMYENMKASEVIKSLAEDYCLRTGVIEDTEYVIPSRVEENKTIMDMMQSALDLTFENRNTKFILYDNFGEITLKNMASMAVEMVIDEEMAEDFGYTTSIDGETYNRIRLYNKDEVDPSKRVTEVKSDETIRTWGVLQYFDTIEYGENAKVKAEGLLEQYNKKSRKLTINKCFGDLRVRAGCVIIVKLNLGDVELLDYMLVEKCKHTFEENEHFMELTVLGGEFDAE